MSRSLCYRLFLGLSLLVNLYFALRPHEKEATFVLRATLPATNSVEHALSDAGSGTRDWLGCERLLAARDYPAAVESLRNIGASEVVIQDILVGAINRRYADRVLALRRIPCRFWEPVQRRSKGETEADLNSEQQARALEAERDKLVRQVVGVDWATIESHVTGRPDPFDRFIESFSPGTQARARQVLAAYDNLERDVIRRSGGTVGLPERGELDQLYSDKVQELRQFLSARDIEEYELRSSSTAEHLKQVDLVGFAPSEDEFRLIFRARKAFDAQPTDPSADLSSQENRWPLWQAQYDMEEKLRQWLGDQRYADYRRSQDYTFRGLIELTDEFELPNSAAVQVHGIREEVLQRIRETAKAQESNEPQRAVRLRQIQADAEASVRTVLGEAAYRKYTQRQVGGWIAEIAQQ